MLRDKGDATRLKSKGNELSQPHKRADDAKDRATSFLNVDPIKVQIQKTLEEIRAETLELLEYQQQQEKNGAPQVQLDQK